MVKVDLVTERDVRIVESELGGSPCTVVPLDDLARNDMGQDMVSTTTYELESWCRCAWTYIASGETILGSSIALCDSALDFTIIPQSIDRGSKGVHVHVHPGSTPASRLSGRPRLDPLHLNLPIERIPGYRHLVQL